MHLEPKLSLVTNKLCHPPQWTRQSLRKARLFTLADSKLLKSRHRQSSSPKLNPRLKPRPRLSQSLSQRISPRSRPSLLKSQLHHPYLYPYPSPPQYRCLPTCPFGSPVDPKPRASLARDLSGSSWCARVTAR